MQFSLNKFRGSISAHSYRALLASYPGVRTPGYEAKSATGCMHVGGHSNECCSRMPCIQSAKIKLHEIMTLY